MKVVVDTNIVFTAMLNPSAMIGQILIFGQRQCSFYAPLLLKEEIKKHKSRIIALAEGMSEAAFDNIRDEIFNCIQFISEEQIPFHFWLNAIPFVRDSDMDDIAFVVLSEYLDAKLWTGDKISISGLQKHGFPRLISTDDLSKMNFYL